MARAAKTKDETAEPDIAKQSRSARRLLMLTLVLSVASLGAGFFLARMAYQQDVATYEPGHEFEDAESEEHADATRGSEKDDKHGKGHGDKDEKGGHNDGDKKGNEIEGLMAFDDILTNINGFDPQGRPTRAFVKLSLVLVYRPEPGAKEQIKEMQPFMRDLFNGYVRGLSESDMRGTVGLLNVKSELLKRARAAAGNDLPQEILISDLIVQ